MTKRYHYLPWVALIMLGAAATCARALSVPPPPVIQSLETAVESADRVVRGTIRPGMVRPAPGNPEGWVEVTLDVTETLKGDAAEQLVFVCSDYAGLAGATRTSWADVLVFLKPYAPTAARANAGSADLTAWCVWDGDWAFLLDRDVRPTVYRMDGSRVADGETLVTAVRESAAYARRRLAVGTRTATTKVTAPSPPPPPTFLLQGDVPPGEWSRADPELWRRPQLRVPADARLEDLARRWAADDNVNVRADAVRVIGQFHSYRSIELLRHLLDDAAFSIVEEDDWVPRSDERAWRFYPVRAAAAEQLNKWNQATADAVVRAPLVRYWPLYWRRRAVAAAAVLLALLLWPRRLRGPTPGAVGVIACAALLLFLAVLWHRGARVTDTLTCAAGNGNWELTLGAGRLAILRVQDDAPAHGWLIRSFDRDPSAPPAWFAPMLTPREEFQRAGVYLAEGVTRGQGAYWYRLLELPYWLLATTTLLWPAAWSVRRLRRARLQERRRREGRCAHCGYSLHGISAPRCPECGAPTHSADAAGVIA